MRVGEVDRPIRIRFWGVRGSYPVPGPGTLEVGGNSACVEVDAAGHTVIFDAGTGIISLGRDLLTRSERRCAYIFLSHTHQDHIEGLRFFEPAHTPGWQCWVYGYGAGLPRLLAATVRTPLSAVDLRQFRGGVRIRGVPSGSRVVLTQPKPTLMTGRAAAPRDVPVVALRQSRAHPRPGTTLYRFTLTERTIVYATDVGAGRGKQADVAAFARRADVLIHDAQYTDEEYSAQEMGKVGWGHSTVRMAAEVAKAAEVGELILFHHAPQRTDAEVAQLERLARLIFPLTRAAREGMELRLR